MSIIIILTLLVLAMASLVFHYRRTNIALTLFALTLLFLSSTGAPTQLLLNSLQTQAPLKTPNWSKRNAIIILGIGTTLWPETSHLSTHALGYSRIHETARLLLSL